MRVGVLLAQSYLERLLAPPVLCDGAMGTELYARGGVSFDRCLDELNLARPELVQEVHLDYIRAGAEVLETNTFGANRIRLAAHRLEDSVDEINQRGVAIAREAVRLTGQQVWVAGAVGPLGRPMAPLGPLSRRQVRDAFQEQTASLAAAGADLIILETFGDLEELAQAVESARESCSLPLVAQVTITEEGRTPGGDTPADIVRTLEALEVAVIGLNCSVGPQTILRVVREMASLSRTPLSALPNAGFPSYVGGRFAYLSSPDYMAEYACSMVEAGVVMVGGCCGTSPLHVERMRDAIRQVSPPRVRGRRRRPAVAARPAAREPAVVPPTSLQQKLGSGFAVTVEVAPPRGFDTSQTLAALAKLRSGGLVDAVNVPDSPMARGRLSALVMATLVQSRLGMETVLHLATRHRNLVALHSELLGAYALGVRNVFVVMGDMPGIGDYPDATAVSDITTSGLIRLMDSFNQGVDLAGRPLEQSTAFHIGCALNMAAVDQDREMRVLERKVKAGAHFLLTQAVYSPELVESWRRRLGGFPVPVLMGVLPLRSLRHAEFLHNEVPGIVVPDEAMARLREAGDRASEVGITMTKELLQAVHSQVAGVYMIPPAGRYDPLVEVLEWLRTAVVPQSDSAQETLG